MFILNRKLNIMKLIKLCTLIFCGAISLQAQENLEITDFSVGVDSSYIKIATAGENVGTPGDRNAGIKFRHFNDDIGMTIRSFESVGGVASPGVAGVSRGLYFDYHWTNTQKGTAMFINRFDGHIGVGTIIPQSKFEVSGGDIRVTNGSFIDDGTTLTVPDYVFASGYHLSSLREVDEYIKNNSHLIGIPSMHDVQGWADLSLQDRDMKFLEKIEELFLHSIEQEKAINRLKAENQHHNDELVKMKDKYSNLLGLVKEIESKIEK